MSKSKITGLDEIKKRLKLVSDDIANKGGRSALRSAANVIRKEARLRAGQLDDPNTPNKIADNIVVRWDRKQFRKTGNPSFRVGILGGAQQYASTKENKRKGRVGKFYKTDGDKKNPGGDTFYWRFLEFGTEKMAPKPFMRPAMDAQKRQAIDKFVEAYKKQLDKLL